MINGLFAGASAMTAFEQSLNNSANNIANVNTNGFKRAVIDFQDLVYTGADNKQVGFGAKSAAIVSRDFRQGPAVTTDNPLDLFIGGQGFFRVQRPNGEFAYTRDGAFLSDANGRVVTEDGFLLDPPITLPDNTISFNITPSGQVNVITADQPDTTQTLGQIQLHRFVNPSGLRSIGRNLLEETSASGDVVSGTPGDGVFGTLQQGVVEGSNVEIVEELTQILTSQRAFEVNSRVVSTSLELLDTAYEIIR